VVVGGLEATKAMETAAPGEGFGSSRIKRNVGLVKQLVSQGRRALDDILPAERVQPARQKRRPFDAALLFLVYPIDVVSDAMAGRIVSDVEGHLREEFGICRYVGHSY
jgi:phosphorylase kinase alpha/beta subunit